MKNRYSPAELPTPALPSVSPSVIHVSPAMLYSPPPSSRAPAVSANCGGSPEPRPVFRSPGKQARLGEAPVDLVRHAWVALKALGLAGVMHAVLVDETSAERRGRQDHHGHDRDGQAQCYFLPHVAP